jgi:hypothetical protein
MMTFDEWWRDSKKSVYWCNNPSIGSLCKCIAQSAYEAAQPKWTLCKDGLPDNDSWVLVYMPETEDFEAMICTAYYTSGDWQSEWDTNQHPISAWMPLPEAPGNIDK